MAAKPSNILPFQPVTSGAALLAVEAAAGDSGDSLRQGRLRRRAIDVCRIVTDLDSGDAMIVLTLAVKALRGLADQPF